MWRNHILLANRSTQSLSESDDSYGSDVSDFTDSGQDSDNALFRLKRDFNMGDGNVFGVRAPRQVQKRGRKEKLLEKRILEEK